jgi:hypothetical protein
MILSHCKENGKMLSVYDISLQKNRIQTLQSPAKHCSAKTKWRGWVQKLRRVGENCHSGCLDSKKFLPTIDGPPGVQGVSKITFFLEIKLVSFWAKIDPKRHKLQKPSKLKKKCQKNPCFLRLFRIFINLGAILAHQTSTGMFTGSWGIFWHPWDPWGRVNSGDTRVLIFVFFILWWWPRLVDFSLLWKYCPMSAL